MAFASESTRFYDPATGQAVGEIMGLNGKPRAATLRDARKAGWKRSVTSIIREAAAPGLEAWKRKSLVLAALTLPKPPEMALDDFIAKIEQDAAEDGKKAAERGVALHKAIQRHADGKDVDPFYLPHIAALELALQPYGIKLSRGVSERAFCTATYGGCPDWYDDTFVMDWKSKGRLDADTKAWDMPHGVQLVAYAYGVLRLENVSHIPRRLLNVFIGVEDKAVKIHEWPEAELPRLNGMWAGLLAYSLAKDGLA